MTESKDLRELPAPTLEETVRRRLHGESAGGPPMDPHGLTWPSAWLEQGYEDEALEQLYDESTKSCVQFDYEDFRCRLSCVLAKFIGELDERERWSDEARANLLDLAQTTGNYRVTRAIQLALRELGDQLNDDTDPELKRRAAELLKVLVARGQLITPTFWDRWAERLGGDYGVLILSALFRHGYLTVKPRFAALITPLIESDSRGAVSGLLIQLDNAWGRELVQRLLRETMGESFVQEHFPDYAIPEPSTPQERFANAVKSLILQLEELLGTAVLHRLLHQTVGQHAVQEHFPNFTMSAPPVRPQLPKLLVQIKKLLGESSLQTFNGNAVTNSSPKDFARRSIRGKLFDKERMPSNWWSTSNGTAAHHSAEQSTH